LVSIVNSLLSPRQETYMRLDYQNATVELSRLYHYENKDWKFTPAPGFEHLSETWEQLPPCRVSDHATQLTLLLNDLEDDQAHSTSGVGAQRTMEFLTALYKSAFKQVPVKAGSITKDDPFYRSLNGGRKQLPLGRVKASGPQPKYPLRESVVASSF